MKSIKYFYFPANETEFKEKANKHYVRTMIVNINDLTNIVSYSRKVNKIWLQTRKNNIETDHRIKELKSGCYHIYAWVITDNEEFNLPNFIEDTPQKNK